MEKEIIIKKKNTLKLYLKYEDGTNKLDKEGNPLYIEIDLNNIKTANQWSKAYYLLKKASKELNLKLKEISQRKEDKKGERLYSKNEQDAINAVEKFYYDCEVATEKFLGKGAITKIFDDRRYNEMFDDLAEMIQPIIPLLEENSKKIQDEIKEKYKDNDNNIL